MPIYIDSLHSIAEAGPHLLMQVATLARLNSGTSNQAGVRAVGAQLLKWATPLEAHVEEIELPPLNEMDEQGRASLLPLAPALLLSKRPKAPLQVLLVGHRDTVFPLDSPFQQTAQRGDRLYGPGVADMKGGLVVALAALQALEASPYAESIGWRWLLTGDEERGSLSSAPLLRSLAKQSHLGLIFEPSLPSGDLISERSGSANYTLIARGTSAHAGRNPKEGRNAIAAMAEWIGALQEWQDEEVSINVGTIHGGQTVNQVPDLCIARCNVRGRSKEQLERVEKAIRKLASLIGQKCEVAIEVHGTITRPPKPFTPRTQRLFLEIAECGKQLGMTLQWCSSGGVCDGNLLADEGLPVCDTLGVRGEGLHSERESMVINSLVERAQLTALLLMKLGSGEIVWKN